MISINIKLIKLYRNSDISVVSLEWSPFNAAVNSGTKGASYCGTWHWSIPVWVSTVTKRSSALKHGCNTGTDKIAGDPANVPIIKHNLCEKKSVYFQFFVFEILSCVYTYIQHLSILLATLVLIRKGDFLFVYK